MEPQQIADIEAFCSHVSDMEIFTKVDGGTWGRPRGCRGSDHELGTRNTCVGDDKRVGVPGSGMEGVYLYPGNKVEIALTRGSIRQGVVRLRREVW